MNISVIKYILLFILLILLQEFVFDNIQVGTLLTPYVYILFILILPFSYAPSVVVILSFLLGLSVDFFTTDILGLHAFACTVIGYFRGFVFKALKPKDDTEQKIATTTIYTMGWRPFLLYVTILVLMHHSCLFILETFKLYNPLYLLIHILLNSLVSITFIILIELAFFRNPRSQS
ncbi:MAG: rod shape-determining protein MreD [Prevotellaceae bacterium]|jgi:rod shape-determining protein MreD|nr:rod shape-determining protein MreD [Prevotellaceae bacterium]